MPPKRRRCRIRFLTMPSDTQNRLAADARVSLPVSQQDRIRFLKSRVIVFTRQSVQSPARTAAPSINVL